MPDKAIHELIQMEEMSADPYQALVDGAQFWTDSNNDIWARIHKDGDPGINATFRLVDWDYGVVPWLVKTIPDGTQTILPNATLLTCTPDETTIYNASSGYPGQIQIYKIDNTAGVGITFNTGFTDVSPILTTDVGIQLRLVYYDGSTWREIALGSGLPAGTENQTIRKNATAWEATSVLKINTTGPENTVDHSTGTSPRMVNIVYVASPGALVAANTVPVGTLGIIYID